MIDDTPKDVPVPRVSPRDLVAWPGGIRDRLLLLYVTLCPAPFSTFLELAEADPEALRRAAPGLAEDFAVLDQGEASDA